MRSNLANNYDQPVQFPPFIPSSLIKGWIDILTPPESIRSTGKSFRDIATQSPLIDKRLIVVNWSGSVSGEWEEGGGSGSREREWE